MFEQLFFAEQIAEGLVPNVSVARTPSASPNVTRIEACFIWIMHDLNIHVRQNLLLR